MSLLPVATNRTSTPLQNQRLMFQLNSDQLAIQRQYDQLSTGRRVLSISDDPAAASRAIGLQRGVSRTDQLVRNASAAEAFYQSADVTLSKVDTAIIEARGAAVEAAQSVLSEDQREALAMTIRQQMEQIVSAGNGMFTDHQLLGGVLQTESALEHISGTVRFNGNQAIGQTKLGDGTRTEFTVTAASAIGLGEPFIEGSSLGAALNADTRLIDMKQGEGVQAGVLTVSDGDNFVELDLRQAATIGDVADIMRSADLDGRSLSVTLGADSITVQYADGLPGTLAIKDAPGSRLASDLLISNPDGFRPPPLIGDRLSPQVTAGTPLADLNNGAGLDLSDGLVIDRGTERFNIDFSDAETIGDVVIAINRSDAEVRAVLNETQGRIELHALRSGVDYSVGENGGTAASELGIRTATEDTLISDLARGRGLNFNPAGPDLVITRPDGVELELELEDVSTVGEIIDLVRDHPDNQDTLRVQITLNDVGNGLRLTAPPGADPIRVTQPGLSDAGTYLGWIPEDATAAEGELDGSFAVLNGRDYQPRDAGGAIDTLLRLEQAVRDGDISEIGRLQARLDVDLDDSTRTRGRVGVWHSALQDSRTAVENENVLLQSQLSDAMDADLAVVISELQARQVALEASMRFVGQTSGITVLNYL
ncbi:flagellin N-terminal helical domain-containing protein [Rhodopirellula europaea]|jgi:flagellar hook-associated protein 3 FlgL|uniref:Flagellar hook-associated protein 3 n=1 Tax=Rhodopirellula europaea SH398 TaxID=1263868 RepID=M5SNJ3_9BACT|nr:flagellin hook IN motif-containing protein [Rhodopirellula europaea]EMI27809.1 flagellar hook-associated protein 3 [Rhodopirellula europaea SH398]